MVTSSDIIDVIRLYREFPKYNYLSDRDIARAIIPSLSLNQFKIFRYPNTDVAYAFTNWAYLNKTVEERFLQTGVLENLDWDRPNKLGINLNENTNNNGKILIAAQHHKSLQLQHLESQELWIEQQVTMIQSQTDREIVVRSHPRSPLQMPSEMPRKITGTYDDFDFNTNYYCVVNYSSGPAIQAAISGTPIITSELSLAYSISNSINNIELVNNLATEQWLAEITHTEYLIEEIEQGLWIERLESQL